MTRDEALEKIKKCMALAVSSNQHEAAAATRQAQKLMAQHGLDEQDVSLADVAECAQVAQNATIVRWESALSSLVAEAFGCCAHTNMYLILKDGKHKRVRTYTFTGLGSSAEIAAYAFAVLTRQCGKDRRSYIKQQPKNCKTKTKVARGDTYAEGWVMAVASKLDRFNAKPEHQLLVKQFLAKKYPDLEVVEPKDRAAGNNLTGNDRWHGTQAGHKAQLHHAVSGTPRPLLNF